MPSYYNNSSQLSPHSFMGLGKFVAGRIHEIRIGESYMATKRSWFDCDEPSSCPHCLSESDDFEHIILGCPTPARDRELLLEGIFSLEPCAPLWTNNSLLQALSHYILITTTGFLPEMSPCFSPPTSSVTGIVTGTGLCLASSIV